MSSADVPADHPLLASLSESDRLRMAAVARRRTYRAGDTVFLDGDGSDGLHLLVSGRVAARATTVNGASTTFAVLGPGDVFGELAVVSDRPRSSTIVALEAATTLVIPPAEITRLRRAHPGIDDALLDLLAARIRRLSRHLAEALHEPADRRIVRRLIEMCQVYGRGSDRVVVPLAQSELAALAGVTRQSVNKRLRELQAHGVLTLSRSTVELADWRALLPFA